MFKKFKKFITYLCGRNIHTHTDTHSTSLYVYMNLKK